jgi:hypothetical protein
MKTPTKVVTIAIAGIVAVTTAVIAAAPQAPKREPQVLTIKANGKAIAVMTLEVLDDAPVEIVSGNSQFGGKQGERGEATFTGGVTIRLRQADDRSAFEIKADEIQMQITAPTGK